jgi:predicted butyrate kinase (DUF1464 family)
MLIESAIKDVAIIKVTVDADEIIISGRLTRIPTIRDELIRRLTRYGNVYPLKKRAKNASEAAEGATIIGRGLMGDRKYSELIKCLKLDEASGTMYDYITMKVDVER